MTEFEVEAVSFPVAPMLSVDNYAEGQTICFLLLISYNVFQC